MLHDIHGDVWEWCEDAFCPYTTPARLGDGLREPDQVLTRVARRGSYRDRAVDARTGYRYQSNHDLRSNTLGVRVARNLIEN